MSVVCEKQRAMSTDTCLLWRVGEVAIQCPQNGLVGYNADALPLAFNFDDDCIQTCDDVPVRLPTGIPAAAAHKLRAQEFKSSHGEQRFSGSQLFDHLRLVLVHVIAFKQSEGPWSCSFEAANARMHACISLKRAAKLVIEMLLLACAWGCGGSKVRPERRLVDVGTLAEG